MEHLVHSYLYHSLKCLWPSKQSLIISLGKRKFYNTASSLAIAEREKINQASIGATNFISKLL
jgi:hypothetical protein